MKPSEQGKLIQLCYLTIGAATANQCGAMEADTISKNGRSSKSHTSRRSFLRIALTITAIFFAFGSFAQHPEEYRNNPKENERVIGVVTISMPGADYNSIYATLLEKAKKEYPNKVIDLRNLVAGSTAVGGNYSNTAKVVELNSSSPEAKLNVTLVKAVDKALSKVNEGSRLAIDQISVSGGLSRETVKDQLIDVLLDKEYKVVAKEYLEKLKEEQEKQMSGDFNDRTVTKIGNFSAVGYFLNIRVNEKSIRVQVINVSTGEYEGNATVEF